MPTVKGVLIEIMWPEAHPTQYLVEENEEELTILTRVDKQTFTRCEQAHEYQRVVSAYREWKGYP